MSHWLEVTLEGRLTSLSVDICLNVYGRRLWLLFGGLLGAKVDQVNELGTLNPSIICVLVLRHISSWSFCNFLRLSWSQFLWGKRVKCRSRRRCLSLRLLLHWGRHETKSGWTHRLLGWLRWCWIKIETLEESGGRRRRLLLLYWSWIKQIVNVGSYWLGSRCDWTT